jgi:hypothetical protein
VYSGKTENKNVVAAGIEIAKKPDNSGNRDGIPEQHRYIAADQNDDMSILRRF